MQEGRAGRTRKCEFSLPLNPFVRLVLECFRFHVAGLGRAALPAAALPCSLRVATGLLAAPGSCTRKLRSALGKTGVETGSFCTYSAVTALNQALLRMCHSKMVVSALVRVAALQWFGVC